MCLLRAISALSAIPSQLTTDGRWMPIHHLSDLALIMSGFVEDGNLVPFVLGNFDLAV
jgi:hypothetical protein